MPYEINKGADRPPQIRGVIGMDYLISLAKRVIGIVVGGGISAVFVPIPGWMIAVICIFLVYVVYLNLVKRSAKGGAGGHEREQLRKKLPGILTVRHVSVYRNLRK